MTIDPIKRDLSKLEDDVVSAKKEIKRRLLEDQDIIKYLHNEELERKGADAEDYWNVNIFPYTRIPGTQDKVATYICISVDDLEAERANSFVMKNSQITFTVFCHADDMETDIGIARHDLLAYLIRDIFNWTNIMGLQYECTSNRENVTDNKYSCRVIRFKSTRPNSLDNGRAKNRFERF